jgi:hypothetical protein
VRCNAISMLSLGLVIAISGCVHRAPVTSAAIRIVEDSVYLRHTPDGPLFRVTSVVRNVGTRPLYSGGCGPEVQRKIDDRWLTVSRQLCLGPNRLFIAVGDSIVIPVAALSATQQNPLPSPYYKLDPGLYRLLFGLGTKGRPDGNLEVLPTSNRVSPTFEVREARH